MNSYPPSNRDDRHTSNQDHDPKLIEYWGNAATTSGNLRIRLRRRIKLGLWRAVVSGSLALKRILDLVVSGCALALLSPLFLITAILIKLDDRGPIFFKQTRVGLKGCTFCIWKFRSMTVNAESLRDKLSRQNQVPGSELFRLFKMKDDPRVTRIGKWIRKFSIDELPQLVNVIRGEMSLVGPRAAVPREVAEYKVEELQRLNLKPGLTCLWQVGGRSNIDFTWTGTTGHPIYPFGEPLAGPQTALEDDSRSPFRNRSLLKTLSLLAPDFAALDSIWRHPLPFVLWPVGHQGLIDHWIDESVRQGAVEIRIYAADRPAEIRRHLSAGGFWSQRAQVTAIRTEVDAPSEAIPMDRLPQQDRQEIRIPDSQTLLSDWLEMQRFWLTHRDPRSVSVDAEVMPDGWLGPHVRVHPRASLHPPFWIGAGTEIGAGCRVGPYAVVGEGSVLDHDVEIENAVALPGTYLGPNTRLNKAIAQGGILVDIRRGCRIDINEDFILGTVARHQRQTSAMGKLAALGLWVLLAPFATLWPGQMWTSKRIINHQGLNLMLEGGSRGPLLLRRWPWLRQVALGNFCWFGILPRGDDEWAYLSAETAERLRSSPPWDIFLGRPPRLPQPLFA